MTYRDDLTALAARHAALETELADKTREVEQASRLLAEARARARLPVLDNIRVAAPCSADWAKMTGDERVRHCGDCKKNVYNLSDMTRDEAEALIIAKEGRLCVRYFQRADGTILLKDCSVGVARRRKRRVIAAGAAALLAGGAAMVYRGMTSIGAEMPDVEVETVEATTMGAVMVAPDSNVTEWMGQVPEPPPVEVKGEPALIEVLGDAR
jgi:hypothetical protein